MKHQKLLSGLILTGLLVLVCLTGSAAADEPTATINMDVGSMTDYFILNTDAVGENYQWYYNVNDTGWVPKEGFTSRSHGFKPQDVGIYPGVDYYYQFKVEYDDGTGHHTLYVPERVHFLDVPELTLSIDEAILDDFIIYSATNTGFDSIVWEMSTERHSSYTQVGSGNPFTYYPDTEGVFYIRAIVTYNDISVSGDFTQTVTYPGNLLIGGKYNTEIYSQYGRLEDTFTLITEAPGESYQWYYCESDGALGLTRWYELSGATSSSHTFTPSADPFGFMTYPYNYYFKVEYVDHGVTNEAYVGHKVYFLDTPDIVVSPTSGVVGDTITLTTTDLGFERVGWLVTDGSGIFNYIGDGFTQTHTPTAEGTYTYKIEVFYPPGFTWEYYAPNRVVITAADASISPTMGTMSDLFTLTTIKPGDWYTWYYSSDRGTTWDVLSGSISPTTSFVPEREGLFTPYPDEYYFKVECDTGGVIETAYVQNPVYFFDTPVISASPLSGNVGDSIIFTATDAGYDSVEWYISKDDGDFQYMGNRNPQVYIPEETGVYTFAAGFTFGSGLYILPVMSPDKVVIGGDVSATINPTMGNITDFYTLNTNAAGDSYLWQYKASDDVTWYDLERGDTQTVVFSPDKLSVFSTYPYSYNFRVIYEEGGERKTLTVPDTVYFFEVPNVKVVPTEGVVGDTISLMAGDTGYDTAQWKVSKDGGPYVDIGSGSTQSHTPDAPGTYYYRVVLDYNHGMYLQTVDAVNPAIIHGGDEPTITVEPLKGTVTTEITLTADNLGVYTDMMWQVSTDGGGTFTNLSTENPYTYVPGEVGEYIYRAEFSAPGEETITVTFEEPVIISPPPETAPISTAAFYIAGLFFIILFMFGLYCVYNDNIFGFIASGFAVLCSWALMALSAFGRVGDTYVFFNEGAGEIVKQVLLIDPSMVFVLIFACLIMTVVFVVIIARFVAQLALLRARDPEEEEEEVQ